METYPEPPSPSPRSTEHALLLPMPSNKPTPSRAVSTGSAGGGSFVSSPLNPTMPSSPISNPFSSTRPGSRASHLDYAQQLHPPSSYSGLGIPGTPGSRGSMLLYRLATDDDVVVPSSNSSAVLLPPKFPGHNKRDSTVSSSGASLSSLDSKFPSSSTTTNRDSAFPTTPRGLVPYEYDPTLDMAGPPDDEDFLHDPAVKGFRKTRFPWRGLLNVFVLVTLILALLCLFVFYPVLTFYRNEARNARIDGNIRINATGQSPVLFQMPDLIDSTTPDFAKTRTGFDGQDYELVFSDEFNVSGRTFYPGDDPFWEAVDLWYGATGDLEWYDPSQVTTPPAPAPTPTTPAQPSPQVAAPPKSTSSKSNTQKTGSLQVK
ncbi:hypothetical protein H0H93_005587 [Arthromyces matolae]|nr:hypothetical protein H0H93_005587 [Arthromyces matolae]